MKTIIILTTLLILAGCGSSVFQPPAASANAYPASFCNVNPHEYIQKCEVRGGKTVCDCVPTWTLPDQGRALEDGIYPDNYEIYGR